MEIKILHKIGQIFYRALRSCIATSLIATLAFPTPLIISRAWAADVSVEGNSAILENLGLEYSTIPIDLLGEINIF